ncbi:MAG: response regulator transcription factor [Chloroflexi bacterium]|nr:response regulator transcription factor [Chloroflexota bacterium]
MKPIRTLLVDDSPEFLKSAARFLAAQSRVDIVGQAHSACEALELVSRLQPDLVLMDLRLPGLNGLEATRRLKASVQPPRVVILTLHDQAEYRRAATDAKADGFIAKAELAVQLMPLIDRLFAPPSD